MGETQHEYDNFKVNTPKVNDGWYLVKNGMTYRVDVPIDKMRFTKSVNILTGEVYYPSNADRFRAMTDEELAELFIHLCCPYSLGGKVECNIENEGCEACWLEWLRKECE